MMKKILVGMLAVAIIIGIASAGYKFGRYLADGKAAPTSTETREAA